MSREKVKLAAFLALIAGSLIASNLSYAQDALPVDNGLATYHTSPRYRESESHPLRVVGYIFHPVGWVLREVFFRPLSYFASSTETTRSVMGFREPFDYRQPECFSADDSIPDCRSIAPYNYDNLGSTVSEPAENGGASGEVREVYFPNVNFDFDVRKLNSLGKGKVHQIAEMLKKEPGLKVVLQGNTDNVGSEEYNLKLGMDRSEAVRSELVSSGIPADRLSTVTFGESQPIFTDDSEWARAVNRRVEVHENDQAAAPVAEEKVPAAKAK